MPRATLNQNSPYHQDLFLESEVLSADPVRLVQILYEAAIESITTAIGAIDSGDIGLRAKKISKAVAIVNELATTLDLSKTGSWGRELIELYDYMARRLHLANFEQRPEPLHEVRSLLIALLEAWTTGAANINAPPGPQSVQRFA